MQQSLSHTYVDRDHCTSERIANQRIVLRIDHNVEIDDQIAFLIDRNIRDFDRLETNALIFADFSSQDVFEVLRESSTQSARQFFQCHAFEEQCGTDLA